MFDVITIGGATYDMFMKLPDARILEIREEEHEVEYLALSYGGKIDLSEHVQYEPGGGGNNSAVAFARLGLTTGFIGCVGQDENGRTVLANLKKNKVNTDFVQRVSRQQTGFSVVLDTFEGERTVVCQRGANDFLTKDRVNFSILNNCKWLYIPSLSGRSHEVINPLMSYAKKYDLKIAWNPGTTQLRQGFSNLKNMFRYVEVLNVNKEEAEELTGLKAGHKTIDKHNCPLELMDNEPWVSDMDEIFKIIHGAGVKTVVITESRKGAQVFDGTWWYWMPIYPYAPIDTLGAGDAFGSTFVAGLSMGRTIADSLRLATANAGIVTTQIGAQPGLQTIDELEQIVQKHSDIVPVRRKMS